MATNEEAAQILEDVLDLIPNEESWWRGPNSGQPQRTLDVQCVLTAMSTAAAQRATTGQYSGQRYFYYTDCREIAYKTIQKNIKRDVPDWNDDPHTSFEDMRLEVKLAIADLRGSA